MSELSKINELNIDQRTRDIVNGYIYNLKTRYFSAFIIPSIISSICLSFIGNHFMLTQGEYQWNITHPKVLRSIYHDSKPGVVPHKSPVFQIAKLNWQIVLYPNGWNDKNKGNVFPCLKLISMPTLWKSVTIERTIIAPQFGVHSIAMSQYSNDQSYPWEQGILSIKDLKSMVNSQNKLSFGVKIKILSIRLRKDNLLYYHFQYEYTQKQVISWLISNKAVEKLSDCGVGRRYSSNVHNNMWTMQLCPNGFNRHNKGQCMLRLALCSLPKNIGKIRVQWIVNCKELGCIAINTKDFEYDHPNFGTFMCSSTTFNKLKTSKIRRNKNNKHYMINGLTLNVEILILKTWDYDGNEVYNFGADEWEQFVTENNEKEVFREMNVMEGAVKKLRDGIDEGKMKETEGNFEEIKVGLDGMKRKMGELMAENESKSERINVLQNKMSELQTSVYNMEMRQTKSEKMCNELVKKMDLMMGMIQGGNKTNIDRHIEIGEFMENEVKLMGYTQLLVQNGFENFELLQGVNMTELKEIGISKLGHRKRIIDCIQRRLNNVANTVNS